MPTNFTATPERIRRIRRESEFARFSDPAVLASRPDAHDGYDQVRESFFDSAADAQAMIEELATELSQVRRHEAAETDQPIRLGDDISLTPVLPKARMVDRSTGLNRVMVIKGLAIDFQADRNSIETIG
jgi:hypothetical protein